MTLTARRSAPLRRSLALSTALGASLVVVAPAAAQTVVDVLQPPSGATVTSSGAAGTPVNVTVNNPRAVVNWTNFNVPNGTTANFTNASAATTAVVLNRVTLPLPTNTTTLGGTINGVNSRIASAGALNQAAGVEVWISNPNGIIMGPTGNINTQGFVATTLGITQAAFLTPGALRLDSGILGTLFVNGISGDAGTINTNNGILALIAPSIDLAGGTLNSGTGPTAFALATDVTIDSGFGSPLSLRLNAGTRVTSNTVAGTVTGDRVYALVTPDIAVATLLNATATVTNATVDARGVVVLAGSGAAPVAIPVTGGNDQLSIAGIFGAGQASAVTGAVNFATPRGSPATSPVGGQVSYTTTGTLDAGPITANGPMSLFGTTGVDFATIAGAGAKTIGFSSGPVTGSAMTGAGAITIAGGGNGGVTVTGLLEATAGGIRVDTLGVTSLGSLSASGPVGIGLTSAPETLTVTGPITAGSLAIEADDSATIAGAVTSAGGYSVLAEEIILGTAGVALAQQAAGAVTLDATGGTITGRGALAIAADSDGSGDLLSVGGTGTTGLALAGTVLQAGTPGIGVARFSTATAVSPFAIGRLVAGTVEQAIGAGAVTAGISRTGAITFDSLALSGANTIVTTGTLGITGTVATSGALTLRGNTGLAVGGAISNQPASDGAVTLIATSAGADVTIAGTDLAGALTVTANDQIGFTSLTGAGAKTLTGGGLTTGGSITGAGAVTLSGAGAATITGAIGATAGGLTVNRGGAVSLGPIDVFGAASIGSGATATLAGGEAGSLAVNAAGLAQLNGAFAADASYAVIGGSVRLASGAQTGGTSARAMATAGTVTIDAGVSLTSLGPVAVGGAGTTGLTISGSVGAGDLATRALQPVTFGTATAADPFRIGNVYASTLRQTIGGGVATAINRTSDVIADNLDLSGATTITTTGAITLATGRTDGALTLSAGAGGIGFARLEGAGAKTLTSAGAIEGANAASAIVGTGAVVLSAGAASPITIGGGIGTTDARVAALTIEQGGIVQLGPIFSSGAVRLGNNADLGALTVAGAIEAGTDLTIDVAEAITLGDLTTAGGGIDIDAGGNATVGRLTALGTASVAGGTGASVAGGTTGAAGDLIVTATTGAALVTGAVDAGRDYRVTGGTVTLGDGVPVTQQAGRSVSITATGGPRAAGAITGRAGLTLISNLTNAPDALLAIGGAQTGDIDLTGTLLQANADGAGEVRFASATGADRFAIGDVIAGTLTQAGGAIERDGAISFGNLTLTGSSSITASGPLTIGAITLGDGALALTGDGVATGALANLAGTTGDIAITATGTGAATIAGSTLNGDLTIDAGVGGAILGALAGMGDKTIRSGGAIGGQGGTGLTIDGGAVTLVGGDAGVAGNTITVDSLGATTALATLTIDGGSAVTLGPVTVTGATAIGQATPVGSLTAIAGIASGSFRSASIGGTQIGAVTTLGSIDITAGGLAQVTGVVEAGTSYTVRGGDVVLGGAGITQAAGSFVDVAATAGTLTGAAGLTLTSDTGDLTLGGAGTTGIAFGGTVLGAGGLDDVTATQNLVIGTDTGARGLVLGSAFADRIGELVSGVPTIGTLTRTGDIRTGALVLGTVGGANAVATSGSITVDGGAAPAAIVNGGPLSLTGDTAVEVLGPITDLPTRSGTVSLVGGRVTIGDVRVASALTIQAGAGGIGFGALAGSALGSGDKILTATGAIVGGTIDGAGLVSLTGGNAPITIGGGIGTIAAVDALTIDGGGAVTIGAAGVTPVAIGAVGDVTIGGTTPVGSLTVNGLLRSGGAVAARSRGVIQLGAIESPGGLSLVTTDAASGDVRFTTLAGDAAKSITSARGIAGTVIDGGVVSLMAGAATDPASTIAITSLGTVQALTALTINGGSAVTLGAVRVDGATRIGQAPGSATGALTVAGTIATGSLTSTTTGATRIGAVETRGALGLTAATLDAGSLLTTGAAGAVTLASDATTIGAVTIGDAAAPLTIDGRTADTGAASIGALTVPGDVAIGQGVRLASLALTGPSTVGGGFTSDTAGATALGTLATGGALDAATEGGAIGFATLSGAGNKTLTAGGGIGGGSILGGGAVALGAGAASPIAITGAIGAAGAPVASLTINGGGAVTLGGDAGATAVQVAGNVAIGQAPGAGTGSLTIAGRTVVGGDLAATTTGATTIAGATTGGDVAIAAGGTATVSGALAAGGSYRVRGSSVTLGTGATVQQANGAIDLTATGGALTGSTGLVLAANADGAGLDAMILDATGGIALGGATLTGGIAGARSDIGILVRSAATPVALGTVTARTLGGADAGRTTIGTLSVGGDVTATGSIAVERTLAIASSGGRIGLTTARVSDAGAGISLTTTGAGGTIAATELAAPGAVTISARDTVNVGIVASSGGAVTATGTSIVAGTVRAATTLGLDASGGALTLTSGQAGGAATLRSTGALVATTLATGGVATLTSGGALTTTALTAAGATLTATGAATLGTTDSTGSVAVTANGITAGRTVAGTTLAMTSGGALTLASGQAGGDATLDATTLASVGAVTAGTGGGITIRAADAAITGVQRAGRVSFVNRAPATNAVKLGNGASAGGFALGQDEVNLVEAGTLVVDGGAGAVEFGALALDADAGRSAVTVLSTGRIDVLDAVTGSGAGRTVRLGGTAAGTEQASVIQVAASANGGGRLLFDTANLDLRGARIGVGQSVGFLDPIGFGTAQGLSSDAVASAYVGNANSSLYNSTLGGAAYSPAGLTFVSARTLTVRYRDYALFQNTGLPGLNSGVALGSASAPVTGALVLQGPGASVPNSFALYGSINGVGGTATAVLGSSAITLNGANIATTRINGCIVGSGTGCLTSVVAQPVLNVFDATRLDVFRTADDLALPFDPVIGTNNEALFSGLDAAITSTDCTEDDSTPECRQNQEQPK